MLKIISGGSAYGARLITDQAFRRGDVVYRIEGYRITEQPTYQTIQVGRHQHIEELGVIAYLNHSCQPNTLIDAGRMEVLAVRDIAAGEELSFFYPSTEWEMDRPFICLCGAPQCVRLVAGAKYLSVDTPQPLLYQSACARDDFRDAGPDRDGRTACVSRSG